MASALCDSRRPRVSAPRVMLLCVAVFEASARIRTGSLSWPRRVHQKVHAHQRMVFKMVAAAVCQRRPPHSCNASDLARIERLRRAARSGVQAHTLNFRDALQALVVVEIRLLLSTTSPSRRCDSMVFGALRARSGRCIWNQRVRIMCEEHRQCVCAIIVHWLEYQGLGGE